MKWGGGHEWCVGRNLEQSSCFKALSWHLPGCEPCNSWIQVWSSWRRKMWRCAL